MSLRRAIAGLAWSAPVLVAACDKPETTPARDSAVTTTAAATIVPAQSWSGRWVAELGGMLVVPSDSENTAVVIFPDSPTTQQIASSPMMLLSATGDTVAAHVALHTSDSVQCGDAPVVGLGGSIPGGWTVGLQSGVLAPMHVDSIEALPAADSARLVANLARLASALTAQRASRFSGLPFAVVTARRFDAGNRRIVAAHLMRRLPQEASPLEEHTLLVAERSGNADSSFVLAYSQRSEGSEETAEHFDVLAVVRAKSSTLLLLARDQVARTEYQILERPDGGAWRVRWSRPLSC